MYSKYTIVLSILCIGLAHYVASQQERGNAEWYITVAIGGYAMQPFVHPIGTWLRKVAHRHSMEKMDKYTLLAGKRAEKA